MTGQTRLGRAMFPAIVQIVTPLYNEEQTFRAYVEKVERVLITRSDAEYRFLLIDDGSTDGTWELIREQCHASRRFRGLRLSRNFGEHTAATAGLDVCDADAVAILPADLQDPPEVVPAFVEAWRNGAEVVFGRRRTRDDAQWRTVTSKIFEVLLRRFAMPRGSKFVTGSFLLMDRKVVECVRQMRETNRLVFGLVAWTGFRQEVVEYDRRRRTAGRSGWSLGQMIKSMYDGLLAFSTAIPRVVTLIGAFFALIGLLSALYFLLNAFFSKPALGWSSIMVTMTLFFGIAFVILGTICEYLLRIHVESTRRPLYFIAADTTENASARSIASQEVGCGFKRGAKDASNSDTANEIPSPLTSCYDRRR
jgi:glycosyltransferase involved in cell wall biosynthesis